MIFPNRLQVVRLNYQIINLTKGYFLPPDNLRDKNSLDWVLYTIQYPLFNTYSTIEEKASLLSWTINAGHVFHDGSKRTGMTILQIFLEVNGVYLQATDKEIVDIALFVGNPNNKKISKDLLTDWIKKHIE